MWVPYILFTSWPAKSRMLNPIKLAPLRLSHLGAQPRRSAYHQGHQLNCGARLLCLCLLVGCFGCRTQPVWHLSPRIVGYSDEEVFSRTWTNQDGRVIQPIGSYVRQSKHFGEFLVVRMGDKNKKDTFLCEIYLIRRIPPKQEVDTSRSDLPLRLMPQHNVNFLLSRTGLDSGDFIIGGIAMREQADRVIFSIDQRANHQYYWRQSDYSRRIAEPWEGGVIQSLTLTRDYEPNWTSVTYGGPPQVPRRDQ
jgi:hypothetical protein